MTIACISDTHVERGMGKLPAALYEGINGVDLILHAGDLVSMDVIEELKAIAPVEAVAGNMDGWDVARHIPAKKVIQAGRFRIGLTHGAASCPALRSASSSGLRTTPWTASYTAIRTPRMSSGAGVCCS